MTQTIDQTLAERGARYGDFADHANVTQAIKQAMQDSNNWDGNLADDQRECLEMVAHKIGRILNGDPDYVDSWTDIIGYTRLVEKRLIDEQTPIDEPAGQDELRSKNPFISAFVDGLKAAVAESEQPCDNPACPTCHPAHPAKPSDADISSALNTLLAAGVIKLGD